MQQTNLSKRLKQLRQKQGFSQEQLAEEAGVSLRTVQRIENGETQSTGATLKLLAAALNVSAEELLDWGQMEDPDYLVYTQLAALTFLIFPLLGIIIPTIMWVSKKDQLKGLNETASALINFQITLNIPIIGIPLSIFIFGAVLGFQMSFSSLIILAFFGVLFLYTYNVVQVLINTYRVRRGEPVRYRPAIRFIRN